MAKQGKTQTLNVVFTETRTIEATITYPTDLPYPEDVTPEKIIGALTEHGWMMPMIGCITIIRNQRIEREVQPEVETATLKGDDGLTITKERYAW